MGDRIIRLEEIIAAPAAEVWKAWSTVEGLRTFLAPDSVIDVRVGGQWEIHFEPGSPVGSRGSEGCKVLEIKKGRLLAFEWNFEPGSPIRDEKTSVSIEIHAFGGAQCQVGLEQVGWKEGADWDAGFERCSRTWNLALARLEHRFIDGPIDWTNPWNPPA